MKQLILICCFVFSLSAMGQMRQGMGMGRGNGMGMAPTPPRETKKVDMLEESLKELTKEIKLDDFQAAIIRGYLVDFKAKVDAIVATDAPDEGKMEKIEVERLKFEEQLKPILNPNQVELFEKYRKKKNKR
ncbi:hypothetical protein [Flavobacterium sp.]|uniref:hypothetical protein n=1 Tax=Flavobacterium sp. TaxID=239 RepID=UPI003B9C2577